jgi:hypothetical protein
MTKRTALINCLSIAILFGSASAYAEGEPAAEVETGTAPLQSANGAAGQAANTAQPAAQSEAEMLACPKGVTCYDGCTNVHQACRCQNTGWAGYCDVTEIMPDIILSCVCD